MSNFIKFCPSRSAGGWSRGADATISVGKAGNVALRVLKSGMQFLSEYGDPIKNGDRVDLYHDADTGAIAMKRADDGMFLLKMGTGKTPALQIYAKRLGELVRQTTHYRMANEKGYAVVLVPMS